ncbi:hypothetical protein AB0K00_51865 [Dactylosporangium sp. NPDC049525]|uniref:hypothetical protein n=1 Tax=Dactylosporangium sp. NPDC049525 TaxID=3154730 RepID=UPI00341F9161
MAVRRPGLAVLAFAVLAAGCTPEQPAERGEPPAVHTPSAAPAGRWPIAGVWPSQDFSGVFAVSAKYVVRPDPRDTRSVVVERRGTGAGTDGGGVVLRHQVPDRRFQTDFAALYGDVVVLVDEDVESPEGAKGGARGVIHDLATGRAVNVAEVPGAPPLSRYGPQATVSADGRYIYSAGVGGGFSNCVGEVDLGTMRGRTVECAPEGQFILYVRSGEHGATWTLFKGAGFGGCRVGRGIRAGVPYTIAPDACDTFDTASVGGWHVRTVQQPGAAVQPASPITATDGTHVVDLGVARGQSLIGCGGYVYWKREIDGEELVRWRPGAAPEVVLRVPQPPSDSPEAVLLTPKACSDGTVLTAAVTRTTGGPFTATVYTIP